MKQSDYLEVIAILPTPIKILKQIQQGIENLNGTLMSKEIEFVIFKVSAKKTNKQTKKNLRPDSDDGFNC